MMDRSPVEGFRRMWKSLSKFILGEQLPPHLPDRVRRNTDTHVSLETNEPRDLELMGAVEATPSFAQVSRRPSAGHNRRQRSATLAAV